MKPEVSPLFRDASCRQQLLWRCDVSGPVAVSDLTEAMAARGFARSPGPDVLMQWRHTTSDHAVLFVPSTGRTQVRLDAFTAKPERRAAAEGVFAAFQSAVATLAEAA